MELAIWVLLYHKDKERVLGYKEYIEEVMESIDSKMDAFIPEEPYSKEEVEEIRSLLITN